MIPGSCIRLWSESCSSGTSPPTENGEQNHVRRRPQAGVHPDPGFAAEHSQPRDLEERARPAGGQSNAAPLFNVGKSLDKFWHRFDPANIDTAQEVIAELIKVLTGYAKAVKKSTPKVETYVTKQVLGSLEKLNELLTEGPREQHRKGKKLVISIERAKAALITGVKDKVAGMRTSAAAIYRPARKTWSRSPRVCRRPRN